jgi:signal transduction histidine kinase
MLKTESIPGPRIGPDAEQTQLIEDLFHALNQPLSSLRCTLELALEKPLSGEQCAETLRQSIAQTEQITACIADVRELWQSGDAGDEVEGVQLNECLQEMLTDFLPVAETAGVELSFQAEPCRVQVEPQRLRQALFRLMEYSLESAGEGRSIGIDLTRVAQNAQLVIHLLQEKKSAKSADIFSIDAREPQTRERCQRLRLAVTRALLLARGGSFEQGSDAEGTSLKFFLPLG